MGEEALEKKTLAKAVDRALIEPAREAEELRWSTPGGRFRIRWDEGGSAMAWVQSAFFAEFLEVTGLFERWVAGCPFGYTARIQP